MNLRSVVLSAALCLSGAAGAADAPMHDHGARPLHGGVLAVANDIEYELVARPDRVQLYLRDHGKTIDVANASARLTLLTGNEKQAVNLDPVGDRLEAKGHFKVGPGTKAVAVVSIAGRPFGSARFSLR